MGHHAVTERRKSGSASGLVEVESHDFNRGSVSTNPIAACLRASGNFSCVSSAKMVKFRQRGGLHKMRSKKGKVQPVVSIEDRIKAAALLLKIGQDA